MKVNEPGRELGVTKTGEDERRVVRVTYGRNGIRLRRIAITKDE